jgi:prolipoprotein diacylglyceryltransferase
MKRNPIDQYMKDPDNKAKVFIWMTSGMIISTIMITIGVILFILYLVGAF